MTLELNRAGRIHPPISSPRSSDRVQIRPVFFRQKPDLTWEEVLARIAREYPEVRQIRSSELAALLSRVGDERPVVLDVRDVEEFAISHLPGARHVLPASDPREALADLRRERPVVAYCAAGVRSARYLKKMMAAGFTHVSNLEGAIFHWANENRPLEGPDGRPAHKVHACEPRWAVLLREDLRVLPS